MTDSGCSSKKGRGLFGGKHSVRSADGGGCRRTECGGVTERLGHLPTTDDSRDDAGGEGVARSRGINTVDLVRRGLPPLRTARRDRPFAPAGDNDGANAVAKERLQLSLRLAESRQLLCLVVIGQKVIRVGEQGQQVFHSRQALSDDNVDNGHDPALPAVGQQLGQFVDTNGRHGKQPAEIEHLQTVNPIASDTADIESGVGAEDVDVSSVLALD